MRVRSVQIVTVAQGVLDTCEGPSIDAGSIGRDIGRTRHEGIDAATTSAIASETMGCGEDGSVGQRAVVLADVDVPLGV